MSIELPHPNPYSSRRVAALLVSLAMLVGACSSSDSNSDPSGGSLDDSAGDSAGIDSEASEGDNTTDAGDELPEASEGTGQPEPVGSGIVDTTGASGYSNESADYLGNPIWVQGPSNVPVKADNDVAIRFTARKDGPVEAASFIIKYDFERDGYHGGDCGDLQVSLRTDDGGAPSDEILTSMTFADPCGGARDIGWLTDQPFDAPTTVVGGDVYHLVFSNLDPDSANFVSINMLYGPEEDPGPRALSTGDGQLAVLARGSEFWSGNGNGQWGASAVLADHLPSFELHYVDDTSQGISYVGARFGSEVVLSADNPTHLRQTFPLDTETTVQGLWFRGVATSDGAALSATLTNSEGSVLFSGPLPRAAGASWFGGPLPVPLTLEPGDQYRVEVFATAGTIEVRPLYQAQHDDWTSSEQSDWRGGFVEIGGSDAWETYVNGIPHDLSLYFDTGEVAPTTTTTTVALYGDSLIGETTFDEPFLAALSARGVDLVGKDNNGGRDVAELLGAVETNPITADVYLVNIGINGGESPEQFEAGVRAVIDQLAAINPEAEVLWTSLHALPVTDFVFERVEPRNAVLEALADEGLLQLVPWFDVASVNTEIYGSDGVHFFGNEQLYVQTMIAGLDRQLAAG